MAAGNAVIGALRVNLGLDSAEFHAGLKSAETRIGTFGKTALASVSAAVTAVTAALTYAVKSTITAADEMGKASQKFGVPVEQLSRLKYAAEMSNVAFETLGTGLRKLAQNMDDAAKGGTSKAAEAFRALGVTVENADGTLRSQENVLGQLAARFAELPDGAQKTALAMAIFGKSGAELIPLLNEGADGIKRLTDEAERFGLTISNETAARADAFKDNLDRMKAIWAGLVTQLTAHLLPQLEKLSELLLRFAQDKVQVDAVFEGIASLFQKVVDVAREATVDIQNFMSETRALIAVADSFLNLEPHSETMAKWDAYTATITANAEKLKQVQAEISKASLPAFGTGYGAGGSEGWSPANDNEDLGGYNKPGSAEIAAAEKQKREMERQQDQIDRLRESLMTEEEAEFASYQKRLEVLNEFEAQRGQAAADSAELRATIEKEYNDKLAALQEERLNAFASTLGSAGSIIESLTKIMGKEGDKQLGIVKALSLAEALINVYTGITAALRLPFPYNIAAAASVAAQGFATIASMKSVSKGSSGSGSASGGSSSSAAVTTSTESTGVARSLTISGISPDMLYSGSQLRGLVDALNQAHDDGYKLKVA